jgi:hypothetical protein
MKTRMFSLSALAVVVAVVIAGAAFAPQARSQEAGGPPIMPPASSFSPHVDNPWFPLLRGTRWVYTGVKDGKQTRDLVTVTNQTKTIDGVPCVAVDDRLYMRGRLEERTTDWYSQDNRGNGTAAPTRPSSPLAATSPAPRVRGRQASAAPRRESTFPATPGSARPGYRSSSRATRRTTSRSSVSSAPWHRPGKRTRCSRRNGRRSSRA